LPILLKLAGLRHTKMRKAEMVAELNAYLSNEDNIIALWSRLHGLDKELMEEYVRSSQVMETEEIKHIFKKYDKQPSWNFYSQYFVELLEESSPARLFFIGLKIPSPIFAVLHKLVKPIDIRFTLVKEQFEDEVDYILSLGSGFERDFIAIVKLANNSKLRTTKGSGMPTKGAAIQMNEVLECKEPLIELEDIRNVEQTTRIYGITQLLLAASVLRDDNGVLALGLDAESFLAGSHIDKGRLLLEAYLNDGRIDELGRIREIKAQTQRRAHYKSCRELILDYLRLCPVNEWIAVQELLYYIKKKDRNFLALVTGEILTYDSYHRCYCIQHGWDEIEGRFVEVALLEYLSAIGMVDIGFVYSENEEYFNFEKVLYFRLNEFGAYLLGINDAYESGLGDSLARRQTGLIIHPNGDITASLEVHKLFFDRFAEKASEGMETVYRLSFASMVNALNQGIEMKEIADYLLANSEHGVPEEVSQMLRDWETKRGKIRIRQALIVETDDPLLMDELKNAKPIRNHIVSDLTCAFEIDNKSAGKVKKEIEKKQFFCTVEPNLNRI
jgi:hypothetical protein